MHKSFSTLAVLLFVSAAINASAADTESKARRKNIAPPAKAASKPRPTMKPETAQFLRSIGIDPKSKEVARVDMEGTVMTVRGGDQEEFSLDSMAAQKKKNGIKAFIATRGFIRLLKKDYAGTSIPKTNYDPLFLTPEERSLVGKKYLEQISE